MRLSLALALMLLTVSLLTVSPDLLAQTRVFVSRSGSDHNSCSIVTPCRTFQRAHDVVADNGEIVPLNSAGYGPVVISKSVSITAPDGVYVGITPPDGHGVHVLGEGIVVYLKGLTIHGNWAPESVGIYMERGARLVVDRCRVSHFDAGISVQTGTHQPVLVVQDCVLDENRDSGIVSLNPLSTVTILRCTVTGGRNGLLNYGGAWNIQDTLVKGVTSSGLLGSTAAGYTLVVGCTFSANGTGMYAGSTIKVVGTKVTGNTDGLFTAGDGRIESGGQNIVLGNGSGETFSGTFALQ